MRSITEIYEALKKDFYEVAGAAVTEGGDMSLRLMAVAAEIFSLEAQCEFTKKQAFPQTADGEYLDLHAAARAITRKEACRAGGVLRFSLNAPAAETVSVPAGTECLSGAGVVYLTAEEGEIPAGELYSEVRAEAGMAGEGGNTAAGSIKVMRHAPVGVESVTNPEAFIGGSEAEDDETLRSRVLSSYRKLPNGANAAYYESLARSITGVDKVIVLPKNRGRGTVDIVFSADSGYPDENLVNRVKAAIEEGREICVDVAVRAPDREELSVKATVTVAEGHSFELVSAEAHAALEKYFGGSKLGEGVYTAKLLSIIMGIEGVENCVLSAPADDIAAKALTLPVLVNVELTEAV